MLQRRLGDTADPQAQRQLEVARLQTSQLTSLIYDLVDIVRLQTGRLQLHRDEVDLAAIVRDAVDAAQGTTQVQTIRAELPNEPLLVSLDGNRISQVLMNLLTNAITYAPETDAIDVSLMQNDGTAEIRVRDFGPGVPEADRERIFVRFSQLEQTSTERQHRDGLGLGLYISREIVAAHGGTLTVDGDTEPGAAFVIRLPV